MKWQLYALAFLFATLALVSLALWQPLAVLCAVCAAVSFALARLTERQPQPDAGQFARSVYLPAVQPDTQALARQQAAQRAQQAAEQAAAAQRQKEADERRRRLALLRDMVEQSPALGLARRQWAGHRTQSGVYCSQADWQQATAVLLQLGAIRAEAKSYALTAPPDVILAQLGLCDFHTERSTGALLKKHAARTAKAIVRIA